MEKEDHSSTVHRVVYNALEALYSGWQLSRKQLSDMSLQYIRKYYKKLSKKYGYEIPVPERTIDFKAFLLFREEKIAEAIEMLKYNVANYPGSAEAYFNLGRAYDDAGKLALAKKNLEMAVKIGEKNKHDELSAFKEALSRLLEKIRPGKTEKTEKEKQLFFLTFCLFLSAHIPTFPRTDTIFFMLLTKEYNPHFPPKEKSFLNGKGRL